MTFEDRLREQLQHQTADIEIHPEGVDVVAGRVRARRTRRTAAAAIAALLIVAGLAGYMIGRSADDPAQVATEGVADDAPDRSDSTGDDSGEEADASAESAPAAGGTTEELPDVALPDPGSALRFTNVESDTSPGGYNVWVNGHARDLYYVLSTAPGLTWEQLDASGRWGPDTLYTYDGDRWATGSFGDRFVSELSGDDRGVLYAISTGSTGGNSLEAGVSVDGGTTWDWTRVDLTGQFGENIPFGYQALTASTGGAQLVVVHRAEGADWQEGVALAQQHGVDVDEQTDEIYNLDSVGISWVPDVYVMGECNAAYSEYLEGRYADDEDLFSEPPVPYEGELTDEEQAQLRAWEEEQRRLWELRQQDAIDHMLTVPGCEEFQACLAESHARERELQDRMEATGVFEELERRARAGEEIAEEEWMAAEEESAAIWDGHSQWMEESGCQVILYGDFSEPNQADVQRITWEELGVVPPASWAGSTHAYLISAGEVRPLGPQFESSTGWLMDVRATSNGFEVVFDDTRYEPFEDGQEPEATITTWSSTDGLEWSSTSSSSYGYEYQMASVAGSTFSIAWAENGSDLIRTNPDGSSDRLLVGDLAPGIDTEGYELFGIQSGPYGVVAWASKWQNEETAARFEDAYDPDSVILYSPDGQVWGATPIDGADIAAVIVGDSDVMVFLADPDFNGRTTPPQPVLLGTAG